jgi:hypothetical protein
MPFPKITGPVATDLATYGGDYVNMLSDLFGGVDVQAQSVGGAAVGQVLIGTPWKHKQLTFYIQSGDVPAKNVQIKGPATINVDKVLNIPTMAVGNDLDTILSQNAIQAIIGKTIDLSVNVISDTGASAGDMLRFDGVEYSRKAKGTALQYLRMNSGATDIEWASFSGSLPANISYKDAIETFTAKKTLALDDNDSILIVQRDGGTTINSRAGIRFDLRDSAGTLIPGAGYIFFQDLDNTIGSTDFGFKLFNRRAGSSTELFKINELGKLSMGANLRLELDDTGLTATRLFAFPDLAGKVMTEAFTQIATNKTVDARLNTLPNVVKWGRVKKYGQINFAQQIPQGGGLLEGAHYYGTLVQLFIDATDKLNHRVGTSTTVANSIAGIIKHDTTAGMFRRDALPLATLRYQIATAEFPLASHNLYFGYSSAQQLPVGGTPLGSGDSGFLIGWRGGTDNNYMIFNNDGTGAAPAPTDTGIPIATGDVVRDMEIAMTLSDITATIRNSGMTVQGSPAVITTRIPATSTVLYFYAIVQATTTTQKTLTFRNLEVEQ